MYVPRARAPPPLSLTHSPLCYETRASPPPYTVENYENARKYYKRENAAFFAASPHYSNNIFAVYARSTPPYGGVQGDRRILLGDRPVDESTDANVLPIQPTGRVARGDTFLENIRNRFTESYVSGIVITQYTRTPRRGSNIFLRSKIEKKPNAPPQSGGGRAYR